MWKRKRGGDIAIGESERGKQKEQRRNEADEERGTRLTSQRKIMNRLKKT